YRGRKDSVSGARRLGHATVSACQGALPLGQARARTGARVDCRTGGQGPESFLEYIRSGRPPETRGDPQRKTPGGPHTGDESSWRARGTDGRMLVGHWNYQPWCHDVILAKRRPLMRSKTPGDPAKQRENMIPINSSFHEKLHYN